MTLATLDDLFGPVGAKHEHLDRYGYREERLNGRKYYVGRNDQGCAIVGPVRHRAKGLLNLGRPKSKKVELPVQERTMKMNTNPEELEGAFAEAAFALTPPPPQEKPGMLARLTTWIHEKWYDEAWHRGARNTAGTVVLWAFVVFALVTFGKGMLWLVTL